MSQAGTPSFEDQTKDFETTSTEAAAEETPAVVETEEAEEQEEPAAEEAEAGTEAGAEGEQPRPKRPRPTHEQRVAEMKAATAEMRAQERALHAARAVAQERSATPDKQDLTGKAQGDTKDADAPPKPDDFEFGELDTRYIDAKVEYGVKKALAAAKATDVQVQQQEARKREVAELSVKAKAFEDAGAEKYDDFDEVVIAGARSDSWKLSETMLHLVLGSDEGVDVAYHLASNPKESREVFGKSPVEQAAYFGRLAAKFSSAQGARTENQQVAVKTSKAPAPVQTARGGGSKTRFDPATASFEEFEAHARSITK